MKRGFTLLELIIVIIVLGILAAAAIPSFKSVAERGRVSEAFSLLPSIADAQDRLYAETDSYGDNIDDLDINVTPKYFNLTVKDGTGASGILAVMSRNSSDAYDICINKTRVLSCTNGTTTCPKLSSTLAIDDLCVP